MFPQTNVKICAETYVAIRHNFCTRLTDLAQVLTSSAGTPDEPNHKHNSHSEESHVPSRRTRTAGPAFLRSSRA